MPRTNVPHQEPTRAGIAVTETAGDVVNQHETPFHPRLILRARNAHATLARLVTLRLQKTIDSQAPPNRTVSVPATLTRYIGPFTEDYRTSTDKVEIDVETVDVSLAVLRLP